MKENKKDKSELLKEAIVDYNAIVEAANNNAQAKLAEKFPSEFNNLLKEELNNKKKKSVNESYKKIDNNKEPENGSTDVNKESVMENKKKETKKVINEENGDGKPFEQSPKNNKGMTGGRTQEHKGGFSGRDKEFTGDLENDTPNLGDETAKDGDIFKNKAKNTPTSGGTKTKEHKGGFSTRNKNFVEKKSDTPNVNEEFDITELDINSVESAIDGIDENDEIITMDDIEREISSMDELEQNLDSPESTEMPVDAPVETDPIEELIAMRDKIDALISNMGGEQPEGEEGAQVSIDQQSIENPEPVFEEEDLPITDADIDAILNSSDDELEEGHGVSHAQRKFMPGRNLPNNDYLSRMEKGQQPYAQGFNESKSKVNALMTENKKLTKQVNESKKYKKSVSTIVENYKSTLEKYRNQLREMAVFNTNLAHVNNLLVNEDFNLSQNEKINIINEFKKIDSITESQKTYNKLVNEMKDGRKTIDETIENKVSTSIQPSSKQKLDEVVEKTAYTKQVNEMLDLMKKVERRK